MLSLILVLPMVLLAQGSSLGRVTNDLDFMESSLDLLEEWHNEEPSLALPEGWNNEELSQDIPEVPRLDLPGGSDDIFRIVGGTNAPDRSVPYIVSLRYPTSGQHWCGGSIKNKRWIITAGHCVSGKACKSITVVAGTENLNSSGTAYKCVDIIVYKGYNSTSLTHDIAVMKVDKDIAFGPKVANIELPTAAPNIGTTATVSGWGSLIHKGPTPNDLQWLDTKIAKCGANQVVNRICTLTKRGEGTCQGDSGGPLTQKSGKKTVLVGVVSGGYPCALGSPDWYASVFAYKDWIDKNTKI